MNIAHHRKPRKRSTTGCSTCRKRKIKCDESRPACTNCLQFKVHCGFKDTPSIESGSSRIDNESNNSGEGLPRGKKRPGRPRKNWTNWGPKDVPVTCPTTVCNLQVSDVELTLQFASHTGPSLVVSPDLQGPLSHFWSHNVPRLGLQFHFVLHLVFSLAAHHLAYLEAGDTEKRNLLVSLAEHHFSLGLAETAELLPKLDVDTCGPLYVASILTCFNKFAAGPQSKGDLLVCSIGEDQESRTWMPLIRGVQVIRSRFHPEVLFSGYLEPFRHYSSAPSSLQPTFTRLNIKRLDWEEPLDCLRKFVELSDGSSTSVRLRALDAMIPIYAATYGRVEVQASDAEPLYRFVFHWMYWLEAEFIASLQQGDQVSLLILAYYAVLLNTMRSKWYMEPWSEHMITSIEEEIKQDLQCYLKWPLEVLDLGMSDGE
ncbi:hypothetical protein LCI18_010640 [Fusarium solani-melongenae]|uniref:Uncharacterized protein n=1 Tax=Fusarium solani subsp. cucurbitae TaxID=2747967 RepID=A0ACD3ZER3_FUSSC|nr:hypothetical protein LCI18_010640 [Fusarium solani-melongenae]